MLVVLLAIQGSTQGTVTAVTYNGVSMTKAISKQNALALGDSETSIWLLPNPPAGAHTISVTATMPTSPDFNGAAVSYFGVNQSTTPDATGVTSGSAAGAVSDAVTTVAANAWIVGLMHFMNNGSTSGSITSSQTIRQAASMAANLTGRFAAVDTNAGVAAGANSLGFTPAYGTGGTTANYTVSAVSLAPAAGAAANTGQFFAFF